jgi:ABC-type transport system involved in multi-copper enzyme maturation permease subunit
MKIGTIHLKQNIKGLRLKLIVLCLGMFLFQMLFAILGTSVSIQQGMLRDLDQVPKFAEKMMGQGFVESIVKYGIITVGYVHPLTLVLFILFIFMAVSQVVTSEITSGTIGFTLSKALSRKRICLNLGIIIYAGLALISFSAFFASYLGIVLFNPVKLAAAPFASLAWNLFLLMIFVAGYVVVFAAVSDTGKKLFAYGGIVLFALYLLSYAAPLWKPLEYLAPVSPFHYYKPFALLLGSRIAWSTAAGLMVVSLVMFAVGTFIFSRRDIASG